MTEIEPCPFCGNSEVEWDELYDSSTGTYQYLSCSECGCSGPLGKTHEEAAELWNTRA